MVQITPETLVEKVNEEIVKMNHHVNENYLINYPDRTIEDARMDYLLHRIAHLDMKIEQLIAYRTEPFAITNEN